MTTFLDKKEQVIDFKLTSYGHYLFSIGAFTPEYYAFFDDNIIYDSAYMGLSESQNNIIKRIKEDTPYIGSLVLFEDAEKEVTKAPSELVNFFEVDITPTRKIPRKDIFKFDRAIGDARLEGNAADAVPSWKLVLLNGEITKVSERDEANNLNIPQIDIATTYTTRVVSSKVELSPNSISDVIDRTPIFSDGNQIILEAENLMFYLDEANTELLTDNFDIEVFQYITGSVTGNIERKFFESKIEQIVDGQMMSSTPQQRNLQSMPSSSVEYYINVLTDGNVDQKVACRGAEMFNRNSYYINLEFDCEPPAQDSMYHDIYGSEVEPEICLD
jgi:hypothetical protein